MLPSLDCARYMHYKALPNTNRKRIIVVKTKERIDHKLKIFTPPSPPQELIGQHHYIVHTHLILLSEPKGI